MKIKFLAVLFAAMALTASQASAAVVFSSSNTDANAGADLNILAGDSASMYVWVINDLGGTIDGLSLSILSSDEAILEATAHNIFNPDNRWLNNPMLNAPNPGTLGDLVLDSNAAQFLTETGIVNGTTVLHSEIVFDATAIGETELTFAIGNRDITVDGVAVDEAGVGGFGLGRVVVSAVPEPAAFSVMFAATACGMMRRRRR